jgi:hypothetical protein
VPDDAEARLVVLGPEHSHSSKTEESPARDFAQRVLDERSGGRRLNRNMLVFVAPDTARLEELRDAVRHFLAWMSIQREQDSLNLDSVQRSQVETRTREWNDAVAQRIGETFIWLLVPSGRAGEPDVTWGISRAASSDPIAVRVSKKLRTDESLIVEYSGVRLRLNLDEVPLWQGDHASTQQLWSYFAQYLYLPRLRDSSVLAGAIENGVAFVTWEQDAFAYADAWDEGKGRYVGLRAGEQVQARIDGASVVVKPEAARRQLDAEKPDEAGAVAGAVAEAGEEARPGEVAVEDARPRRFYGTVSLDPIRMSRDASQLADEVVKHLAELVDADVEVRVEISATSDEGFDDDVVRTVTENARTLKFDQHAFEER